MRRFLSIAILVTSFCFAFSSLLFDTDVTIISNNDLDSSNLNRAGALFLSTPFTCLQAASTCEALQEKLLAPSTDSENFTWEDLTSVLVSKRHGVALELDSSVWVASSTGCATFTLGDSSSYNDTTDPLARFPALYNTRQIDVWTPKAGILRGFRDMFTWRFLGIKYATSTAGQDRFHPPTPLFVPPNSVHTALAYGPFCSQPPDSSNGHLWYTDEDCLSLNVYSPIVREAQASNGPKLPVMFYIHGGALNAGGSGPFSYNMTSEGYIGNSLANVYDGTNLVSYGDVVLVTISYRLTAFGWFNGSNAALKDALLALQWVQDNIESFGGDPTKVLIFGQSAGGAMVRYLLGTNPKYTHGLFSAAVLMSDFSTILPFYSLGSALKTSLTLAKHLGCASSTSTSLSTAEATCVQGKPASEITLASHDLGIYWGAIVDGDYILADIASSIQSGVYAQVPTLWTTAECDCCGFLPHTLSPTAPPSAYVDILPKYFNPSQVAKILNATALYPYDTAPANGKMSGAMWTFAQLQNDRLALCPSRYLAGLASSRTNAGNVYHALFSVGLSSPFTPNPDLCQGRVCHADDLYWVFGTAETDGLYQPLAGEQLRVAREVIKRWAEMAWSGSPNYDGVDVVWEAYGRGNEAVLNVTGRMTRGYRAVHCDFIANELGLVFGHDNLQHQVLQFQTQTRGP